MRQIMSYQDSSSDDEGPQEASLFWRLPQGRRHLYRRALQAMRRARNRRSYVLYLARHGFDARDAPRGSAAARDAGAVVMPQTLDAQRAGGTGQPRVVELPTVMADADVLQILERFASLGAPLPLSLFVLRP